MISNEISLPGFARGEVRPHTVLPAGRTLVWDLRGGQLIPEEVPGTWVPAGGWEHNDVMYDAATILAELLRGSPDGKQYNTSALYLEFENDGGAAVSPPTINRGDGISYYNGLSADPNRDYIRVAITSVTMDSTDTANYPGGNRLTFFGQTAGVLGVHGKTFSDSVSSRVYGGALVSTPVFADATQDLVLSRFYFTDTDNQLIKLAGSQIGLSWRFKLV